MKDARKRDAKTTPAEPVAPEANGAVPEAPAAQDADQETTTAAAAPDDADAPAEQEPEPTAEELLAAERDDLREKWLRALADLDNLRKRSRREVQDARRFAQVEVLRPLLEVADNFDRAVASFGSDAEAETDTDAVREGVALIHQSFRNLLRDRGVERIEALGREFDPNEHEAVAQVPSEDQPSGAVIEVVQEGYRFGDIVLRPARVVIAS